MDVCTVDVGAHAAVAGSGGPPAPGSRGLDVLVELPEPVS